MNFSTTHQSLLCSCLCNRFVTPDAASAACVDKLIASGWSVRQVRIGLQVIGMLGPAACLLLAVSPVVGGSPSVASALITVGLGFSALTLGGVSTSHLDIAPKHAGGQVGAGRPWVTPVTCGIFASRCILRLGLSCCNDLAASAAAGAIFGAGNTAATLAGFISVPVTGYLLEATNSWPLVFGITAVHYLAGSLFWALWCGDRQLPEDSMDDATPALKA